MAKNFPYFKFIATEWLTGDIVFEDYELQGIFINVCAIYWHRNGDVTISEVEKRLKTVRLNSLSPRFISVINGKISIAFLDEQLIAANHKSKVNSGNGKLGGRPKILIEKPNANQTLTERKAKKSQLKEEKEKEYNNTCFSFIDFWNTYPVKIAKAKCEVKYKKLSETERQKIKDTINKFINYKPFDTYTHPHPETYINQQRWNDEIKVTEVKRAYPRGLM